MKSKLDQYAKEIFFVTFIILFLLFICFFTLKNYILNGSNSEDAIVIEEENIVPNIKDKEYFVVSKVIVEGDTCIFIEYGVPNCMTYSWQIIYPED